MVTGRMNRACRCRRRPSARAYFGQLMQTAMAAKIGVDHGGANFRQGGIFTIKKHGHMSDYLAPGGDGHQRVKATVGVEGSEPVRVVEILEGIGIAVGAVEETGDFLGVRGAEGPNGKGFGGAADRAGRLD